MKGIGLFGKPICSNRLKTYNDVGFGVYPTSSSIPVLHPKP